MPRTLIVDDDPEVLDVLSDAFVEHGCDVVPAFSADHALELLGQQPFDLLVTDIRLPGRNGLELLRAARQQSPDLTIVLTTGLPSVNSAVFALRHGAYDYLLKPVSMKDIAQLLQRLAHDRPRAGRSEATIVPAASRRERQLDGLFRIAELAIEGVDAAAFIQTVLSYTADGFRSDAVLALLRDADGNFTRTWKGDAELVDHLEAMALGRYHELAGMGGREAVGLAQTGAPAAGLAALVSDRRHAVGVLCVGRHAGAPPFDPEESDLLVRYAQNLALGLKASLLDEQLETDVIDAVGVLITTLESRDPSLSGHSARVSLYASELAAAMGLGPAEVAVVRRAGALHDLGRLVLTESILLKPGPLTDEEYALVHRHPGVGARILRGFGFLAREADVVERHLERYDGAGDRRPEPAELPMAARIVKVVDALDAMTSTRPHRPALSLEAALAELSDRAGTEFDPAVVEALLTMPRVRLQQVGGYRRAAPPDAASQPPSAAAGPDGGADPGPESGAPSYLVVARGYQHLLDELKAVVGGMGEVRVITDRRTDNTILPREGREGTARIDVNLDADDLG